MRAENTRAAQSSVLSATYLSLLGAVVPFHLTIRQEATMWRAAMVRFSLLLVRVYTEASFGVEHIYINIY